MEQCSGFAAQDEVLHRARSGAPRQPVADELRHARLADSRLAHQRQRVLNHVIGHRHAAHQSLQIQDLVAAHDRLDLFVDEGGRSSGDLELLVEARVANEDLEHEAVLLRLGQRIGAFLLDGVLRRQDEERIGQPVTNPADRDLAFLHGLEQCGLRLGRRAIDLVGQDDVGEQRPFQEPELAVSGGAILLDHLGAGDVRRHQVGRELDTAEGQRQALGQRANHERLGQSGNAFENAVAPAEESDKQFLDDLVLADDNPRQLPFHFAKRITQALNGFQLFFGEVRERPRWVCQVC